MSRNVSDRFREAAFAPETGEVIVVLLTISHGGLSAPIRISSDPTQRLDETTEDVIYGTISRGNEYIFFPFDINLPTDEAEAAPQATITVDNIRQEITEAIRSISTPPAVTIDIVLAETPDTIEASFPEFDMVNVTYDSLTVTGVLTLDSLATEPYPADRFNPAYFPGLFGG